MRTKRKSWRLKKVYNSLSQTWHSLTYLQLEPSICLTLGFIDGLSLYWSSLFTLWYQNFIHSQTWTVLIILVFTKVYLSYSSKTQTKLNNRKVSSTTEILKKVSEKRMNVIKIKCSITDWGIHFNTDLWLSLYWCHLSPNPVSCSLLYLQIVNWKNKLYKACLISLCILNKLAVGYRRLNRSRTK